MSLLGRLEDLSLTDIVQIVFLSRRTGILEIIDSRGRYTVLFRHGMIVNVSAPDSPDLGTYLRDEGLLPEASMPAIRASEQAGVPPGTAAIEMNLMTKDALATAITQRIRGVIEPLLASRDGEFNFILSDSLGPLDMEYEPDTIFREGGVAPQKVIGADGEKIKPLRGLEESMKAGKALLRGGGPGSGPDLNLNLGPKPPAAAEAPPAPPDELPAAALDEEPFGAPQPATVVPFPQREEAPFDLGYDDVGGAESLDSLLAPPVVPPPAEERETVPFDETPPEAPAAPPQPEAPTRFRVAGGDRRDELADRNVILFERDPMVRVAARRAFSRKGFNIFQFGGMGETRVAIGDLLRQNHFFITFLELTPVDLEDEGDSIRLLQAIKKKNRHLPVVVIDREADLRRRHRLLKAGADLYLTKPSEAHLQPGLAEEELALFADELVLFAAKAYSDWQQLTGTFAEGADVGRQFYDIARKEKLNRSSQLLKQFINELSNPNDITQITQTILHLAAEYIDRGALFVVDEGSFVGLGGFGLTGDDDDMSRHVRRLRIQAGQRSVLEDVANARSKHHGKLQKTDGNVTLIRGLGSVQPTEVVALPVLHDGEPVGVLYGDNAEQRGAIEDTAALEIFLEQAGYAFGKAVKAKKRQRTAPEERER